jgi:4-amino-4-deoxy-L-arabinose transferase-like glycosyltransferase
MALSFDQRLERLRRYWERHSTIAWILSAFWVLAIGGIAFFWNLGNVGLVDETEPLFAQATRQMTLTGDWITPYFNGETRFDKPPLLYWLMAIAYRLIGPNEWATRLPSALSAIVLMGMGLYTLRRFGLSPLSSQPSSTQRWLSAWIGAALMALNLSTLIWGRTGVSDMLLTGCMGLALLTFFCGYATHPVSPSPLLSPWYLACYILTALAVLTKGPVGLVLPGLIVGSFLLYVGRFREVWREMRPLWGIGIMLAIALPWYVLVTLANGDAYIKTFFGYHNLERFTSVVNHHSAPWYFYLVVVLLGFAPWSFYLPVAIARLRVWQRSLWQQQPRSHQLGLFAWFWCFGVFGFFTIAVTKLPSYVLPLMPAAAILVALFWSEQMTQPVLHDRRDINHQSIHQHQHLNRWGMKLSGLLNSVFFLAGAGAILYSPRWFASDAEIPAFASLLQASGVLEWGAAIAITAALIVLFLLFSRHGHWLWLVNLVTWLALLIFTLMPALFIVDAQRQLPIRQLAQTVVERRLPGEALVMISLKKPSLVFYAQQPVVFVRDPQLIVRYLREQAHSQSSATSLLLLGYPQKLAEVGLQTKQYQILDEAGAYQLVRVSRQELARL